MEQDRTRNAALLVASFVLVMVAGANINRAVVVLRLSGGTVHEESGGLTAFELIDSALAGDKLPQYYTFAGKFEAPFAPPAGAAPAPSTRPAAGAIPLNLQLKGVLKKDSPLAIIIDETGKTHICKRGDQVGDYTITEIAGETVRLRRGSGTYELSVPGR